MVSIKYPAARRARLARWAHCVSQFFLRVPGTRYTVEGGITRYTSNLLEVSVRFSPRYSYGCAPRKGLYVSIHISLFGWEAGVTLSRLAY